MSNGAGLGISLTEWWRKKASWRASIARMEAGACTILGSETARPETTLMTAPIPTDVMMLARAKNSSALVTGKLYLQGAKVGALFAFSMSSAVCTWMSSCACTRVTTSIAWSCWWFVFQFVRFCSPSRKNADSMFSRKLTPLKSAMAEADTFKGAGPLGGPPPAMAAMD